MKFIIYFVIYFFLSFNSYAQKYTTEKDSLKDVLKNSNIEVDRASAHARFAWLSLMSDSKLTKNHLDSSYAIYLKLNNEKGIASSNYKYAVYHRFAGDYKKGLDYINKTIEYGYHIKDTFSVANSLYQKAVIYSLQGDYEKGLVDYYKILSIYETLNFSKGIGLTLNSIGITYRDLEKYPEAIDSYLRAIKIHEQQKDSVNLANVYSNLAQVYGDQDNFDLALEYFNKAREIDLETNNSWGLAINSENIGVVLSEQGVNNEALIYLNEAHKICVENNYKTDLARILTNLGGVYFRLKDYKKSEYCLKNALDNRTNSKLVTKEIHNNLFELYKETNRFKLALNHFESFNIFKDSIFEESKIKNINALEIKYETEKKDKEIVSQQLELKEQESEIQKKKTQNNYMLGIVIFLALTAILLVFLFKQRQKRKNQEILTLKREVQIKTLESLIEGEEKERFRIAKELHDGVNGDLSAIKYKLSSLLEMNNIVIKEAIIMIDNSCKQVRAISHNLVPPSLEKFNLVEATEEYCTNLNGINPDVEFTFQHIGDALDVSKKAEVNVFRIIQELITNSIKHADASAINVQISCHNNIIQVSIEDDGKGFDKDEVKPEGIGLNNVQSRIDYLKASVDFISNENGTSYTIDIDKEKLNDN